MTLNRLPSYSPNLMPVESLWRWMREQVTQNYCHKDTDELCKRVEAFVSRALADPEALYDRLEVPAQLNAEKELLLTLV